MAHDDRLTRARHLIEQAGALRLECEARAAELVSHHHGDAEARSVYAVQLRTIAGQLAAALEANVHAPPRPSRRGPSHTRRTEKITVLEVRRRLRVVK